MNRQISQRTRVLTISQSCGAARTHTNARIFQLLCNTEAVKKAGRFDSLPSVSPHYDFKNPDYD